MNLVKVHKISQKIEENTIRIKELQFLMDGYKFDDQTALIIYKRIEFLIKGNDILIGELKRITNS